MDEHSSDDAGRNVHNVDRPASDASRNRLVELTESIAFGRRVKTTHLPEQKGLKSRAKSFFPVSIYKFIVKLTSLSPSEQKSLGMAIAKARKVNSEAWNRLGQLKAKSSPHEIKKLQLACESSQLRLDQLEGRGDSPVAVQRSIVVELLNQAVLMSDAEIEVFEIQYIEAIESLKEIQLHEAVLESELHAAKIKLKKQRLGLEVQISRADEVKSRKGCEVLCPTDEQVVTDAQILVQGKKAKELLDGFERVVVALQKEFDQFQKVLIDETVAREAHLRYGNSVVHKKKGNSS